MRWVLVPIILFLIGCSDSDPARHFETSGLPESYRASFARATLWWESELQIDGLFSLSPPYSMRARFGSMPAGVHPWTGAYADSSGIVFDESDPVVLKMTCFYWISRHELGHILGFPHSNKPGDIMSPIVPAC